jgi:hypothetical protein
VAAAGDGEVEEEEERRRETGHGSDKIGEDEVRPQKGKACPARLNATVVRSPPPDGIWTASELWGGLNGYGHPTQTPGGMCLRFQNKDTLQASKDFKTWL